MLGLAKPREPLCEFDNGDSRSLAVKKSPKMSRFVLVLEFEGLKKR